MFLRKLQRIWLDPRRDRLRPAIKPAQQRNHRDQFHHRVIGKMFLQFFEMRIADARRMRACRITELERALVRRETLADRPIGANAFHLEENFITGTRQRIIRQDQAIVRATRSVEKALRSYLLARRQTRAMEIVDNGNGTINTDGNGSTNISGNSTNGTGVDNGNGTINTGGNGSTFAVNNTQTVGSSTITIRGSPAIACASPSRCRMPPE